MGSTEGKSALVQALLTSVLQTSIRPKKICLFALRDQPQNAKNLGWEFYFNFFSSKAKNMKTHRFQRKMSNSAVESFTFSSMKYMSPLNDP